MIREDWRVVATLATGEEVTIPHVRGSGSVTHELAEAERATPTRLQFAAAGPLPSLIGATLRATYWRDGTPHPLGTYVATTTPGKLGLTDERTVTALDLTQVLVRRGIARGITLPVTTPVAETVRDYLDAAGLPAAVDDTDETLRTILTYPAGTPELTICNDLLRAAGYRPLSPNPEGILTSSRWRPPSQRPTVAEFSDAVDGLSFKAEVDVQDDVLEIPNRIVAKAAGGQANAPLVGLWEDVSPTSRWAPVNRGGQVVTRQVECEATSQEAANAQAMAEGIRLQAAARQVTIATGWSPVMPGDVVALTYARHGIEGLWEVASKAHTWRLGANTTYTLREVR